MTLRRAAVQVVSLASLDKALVRVRLKPGTIALAR
jgi:hypothetical protein